MHQEDLVELPREQRVPRVAVHLFREVIAVEDISQRIDDDDRGEDGVKQNHVVALGDLQARLQVLYIGDVLEVRRVPRDDSALISRDPGGVQDAPRLPALGREVRLQVVDHVGFRQAQDLVLQLGQVSVERGDVRKLPSLVPADELIERRVCKYDGAAQVGGDDRIPDIAEQLLKLPAVACKVPVGSRGGGCHFYQRVEARRSLHRESGDGEAAGSPTAVLDQGFPFAGCGVVHDPDLLQELFFARKDIRAVQADGFQQDFVEENDLPFTVDNEKTVRELLDDLQ